MLFQIDAPHFCVGGEILCGRVTNTAPIIKYMDGWFDKKIIKYCKQKKWKFRIINNKYTHCDSDGILWRFKGNRPISEIADKVMQRHSRRATSCFAGRRIAKEMLSYAKSCQAMERRRNESNSMARHCKGTAKQSNVVQRKSNLIHQPFLSERIFNA